MLSPKMQKSQIYIVEGGGRGGWWPTSDAESKNVKIPNSHFHRCGKGRIGSQLLMVSPKILKPQIHIFTGVGKGRVGGQLLMLSPKMLKSQIHIFTGGRGHQQPTFDAKSINAKILTSHFCRGRVGGQLLMLSPKIPTLYFCRCGGGGVLAANF